MKILPVSHHLSKPLASVATCASRQLSFRLANVLPDAVFLISSGLAGFLIKSLNSDEFKSTGLGNEKSELKTLKYSVKKEKL